jgi:hypothetical protein
MEAAAPHKHGTGSRSDRVVVDYKSAYECGGCVCRNVTRFVRPYIEQQYFTRAKLNQCL